MNLKRLIYLLILSSVCLFSKTNKMLYIKGGTFKMGDVWGDGLSDEKIHKVTLSGFYMSKYEITIREYLEFLNNININKYCYKKGNQLIDMDAVK